LKGRFSAKSEYGEGLILPGQLRGGAYGWTSLLEDSKGNTLLDPDPWFSSAELRDAAVLTFSAGQLKKQILREP
jgi:hypothetical protein